MTKTEQAAANFKALDAARIAHEFHGAPAPVLADFGYRHGWVSIDGESFNREMAFPAMFFPRFPIDQGLND